MPRSISCSIACSISFFLIITLRAALVSRAKSNRRRSCRVYCAFRRSSTISSSSLVFHLFSTCPMQGEPKCSTETQKKTRRPTTDRPKKRKNKQATKHKKTQKKTHKKNYRMSWKHSFTCCIASWERAWVKFLTQAGELSAAEWSWTSEVSEGQRERTTHHAS